MPLSKLKNFSLFETLSQKHKKRRALARQSLLPIFNSHRPAPQHFTYQLRTNFSKDTKTYDKLRKLWFFRKPSIYKALRGYDKLWNPIENRRSATKSKTIFPTDDALFKILYLAMCDITEKWTGSGWNWGQTLNQLCIYFGDRISPSDLEWLHRLIRKRRLPIDSLRMLCKNGCT